MATLQAPPPQVPGFQRVCDMVEDGRVVVRHVFYGRTEAEAKHMERAHVKADASLRAATEGRKYKGTSIQAVRPGGMKEARAIMENGSLVWLSLRESQSGGRGPIARGTLVLGDQRQVPQVKGRPRKLLSEVGWTDEARAAATAARQHGYEKQRGASSSPTRVLMAHRSGSHLVSIHPSGRWTHYRADGSGVKKGRYASGLDAHLGKVHGAFSKEAEVGWTDDARAAAIAARRAHAAKAGSVYEGVQHTDVPGKSLHLFTDMKYGSTFAVPVTAATAQAVKIAADKKREQMAAGGAKELTREQREEHMRNNSAKWERQLQPTAEGQGGEDYGMAAAHPVRATLAEDTHGHYVGEFGGRRFMVKDAGGRVVHRGDSGNVAAMRAEQVGDATVHDGERAQRVGGDGNGQVAEYRGGRRVSRAWESKDAKGHGSARRSVWAPASHDEPTHPAARTETPKQRAARIRKIKVPADRAAVIRKALGMKEVKVVRAVLVAA